MLRSHSVLLGVFLLASIGIVLALAGCTQQNPTATDEHTANGRVHDDDRPPSNSAEVEAVLAKLSPEDRRLAKQQQVCPVTGEPLGSMGVPTKISLEGKSIFICCAGCEDTIRENPEKYVQSSGR